MMPFLLWFILVEIVSLAALPLAMAVFPRLADRGYGLAKVLGVLLVTYLNYLLGSTLGLGNNAILLALGMVVVFVGGGLALGGERAEIAGWFRANRHIVLTQELIFLGLFLAWTLVRAAHPGILSTEKPMDLALMTASHKATAFPPYDPWLAGQMINYYYGGYLAAGTLVTLTGVAPAVGYNLALALLFALVGTGAFSVAYGLTRDLRWALLGPIFVLLIGNLDGLGQLLNPAFGTANFQFFHSSRIVEPTSCSQQSACTITEFPAFSFLLGDLHPHVMALPFTILAIGMALNLALAPAAGWIGLGPTNLRRGLTLLLAGVITGALYFMNSWDWPAYTLLCAVALLVPALPSLAGRAIGEAVALAAGVFALSYLLYVEFRLDFKPQYSTFGLHAHGSPTGDVLTMFGLFLLPVAAFVIAGLGRRDAVAQATDTPQPRTAAAVGAASRVTPSTARAGRGRAAVLEREPDEEPDDLPRLPMPALPRLGSGGGSGIALVVAALLLWALFRAAGGLGTFGLLLPFAAAALYLAWRAARAGRSHDAFALLLCAGGIGLIMLCDTFYLKDNFCGGVDASGTCTGELYRMNTVFKFYYQAWTVLALGAAYGLYYLSTRLRVGWQRGVAPALAVVVAVAGGVYMLLGLFTPGINVYTVPVANAAATLDGSAYLDSYSGPPTSITNAIPNDAAAIRWLVAHTHGHPTILEADLVPGSPPGPQDYWRYPGDPMQELMMSRISTFTGLPTVLGWGYSHEGLWHGDAVVGQRFQDVQTMYTSADRGTVEALLRKYGVSYIYVGGVEDYVYDGADPVREKAALARLESLGTVVYNVRGVTIIRTPFATG